MDTSPGRLRMWMVKTRTWSRKTKWSNLLIHLVAQRHEPNCGKVGVAAADWQHQSTWPGKQQ
eukprot:12923476-Prorocentrum_lima.AAC.1